METFKINRGYHFWMDKAKVEASSRKEAGFSDENIQEAISSKIKLAQKSLEQNSGDWQAITVLYSYAHGVTGENMHFVRIDSAFRSGEKLLAISEHKAIFDAELQELKKRIV